MVPMVHMVPEDVVLSQGPTVLVVHNVLIVSKVSQVPMLPQVLVVTHHG